MRKSSISIIVALIVGMTVLAAQIVTAQANPCEYNLIGAGSSGVAAVDTSVVGAMQPRCTPCVTQGCVAWQLPADTSYHLAIYTLRPSTVSVQIVIDCDYLLWDTCAYISGDSVSPPVPLFLSAVIPANSQIVVCSGLGDTIAIEVKATAPNNFPAYLTPTLDLSTCAIPLGLRHPTTPSEQFIYIDLQTLQEAQGKDLAPFPAMYIKRKRTPR